MRIHCGCGGWVEIPEEGGRVVKCRRCGTGWRLRVQAVAMERSDGEWNEAERFCEHCGKGLSCDDAECIDAEDGVYQCRDRKACEKRLRAGCGIGPAGAER
jgi:hypothetical protein